MMADLLGTLQLSSVQSLNADRFQSAIRNFTLAGNSVPGVHNSPPLQSLPTSSEHPALAETVRADAVELSDVSRHALESVAEELSNEEPAQTSGDRGRNARPSLSSTELERILKEIAPNLDETTAARIRNQLDGIVQADGLRSIAQASRNPVANTSRPAAASLNLGAGSEAGALGDLETRLSPKLAAYLELIRKLNGDDTQLTQFLDAVDRAIAEGGNNLDSVLASFYSHGADTVQTEVRQEITVVSFEHLQLDLEMHIDSQGNVTFQSIQQHSQQVQQGDPLVLDLDGDGIELSGLGGGVQFDITGDGVKEQTAFATGDDVLLALDRNGNGTIDSGRELFGDQNGARNGLEELAKFDDNQDGIIDGKDSIYNHLLLFSDRNRDGTSQRDELRTLTEVGIASIDLRYRETLERLSSGNSIAQVSSFTRSDGTRGRAADALLQYLA